MRWEDDPRYGKILYADDPRHRYVWHIEPCIYIQWLPTLKRGNLGAATCKTLTFRWLRIKIWRAQDWNFWGE